MRYIYLTTIFTIVYAYEKDMTFIVQPGKVDCFYEKVLTANQYIDIDYQVIDASQGELDISFQLSDPEGRLIVADYKKPENNHRHLSRMAGVYKFCFDNTFSTFSEKTVFFDLVMDPMTPSVNDYYLDDKEMELGLTSEKYMMRVRDISESVDRVIERVQKAKRLQEKQSAHEARDRNLAEELCSRVLSWSLIQMTVMVLVAIVQVIFVRSLFEDAGHPIKSTINKYVPNFKS